MRFNSGSLGKKVVFCGDVFNKLTLRKYTLRRFDTKVGITNDLMSLFFVISSQEEMRIVYADFR